MRSATVPRSKYPLSGPRGLTLDRPVVEGPAASCAEAEVLPPGHRTGRLPRLDRSGRRGHEERSETMHTRDNQHAVVIGGSMAGMLTARALAEHFDQVTIIERDELPESADV